MRVSSSLTAICLLLGPVSDLFSQSLQLQLERSGAQPQLSWPASVNGPAGVVSPEYEVQYSADLVQWAPLGGKVRGISGLSGTNLSVILGQQDGPAFYRVVANLTSTNQNETGSGGAQVLGYDATFATRLGQLGLLSVGDFATNSGNVAYLPHIGFDPTTANFWSNFNSAVIYTDNVPLLPASTNVLYNYVLNSNELAIFLTNGFVVSEALGSASFGDAYYRIFNADMPVFVSCDSVLHAWHRSYQAMLTELEENSLAPLLGRLVTNMSLQLPAVWNQYGQGPLSNSILDADYLLTVARSLLANGYGPAVPSALGDPSVDQAVVSTVGAIGAMVPYDLQLFGSSRVVDFSQFLVRGHYASTGQLTRYFLAMMWFAQIDLRVATFPPNKEDDIRQLGTAIILNSLMQMAGEFDNWASFEKATRAFVGVTDSMTFAQLKNLLLTAKIQSPADVSGLATLTNLQTRILSGEAGVQAIQGEPLYSPFGREQLKLPRSFTVYGQKFAVDSWAFSQLVFDRILWTPDYGTNIVDGKVMRRRPSCLDVAFSVLGNDQVVDELVARMVDESGEPFRDGPHLPYQHNLLAVRQSVDAQDASVWTDNIYNAWISVLRALSAPTTDAAYPESMRTRAWAMKTLNTQLASWAELRHDTELYVRQSGTASILCGYPAAFVEPRPVVWNRLATLAGVTANAISTLSVGSTNFVAVRSNQLAFLTNFQVQVSNLELISSKELLQQPLSSDESGFLQNLIETLSLYSSYRHYDGWYPNLYYKKVGFPTAAVASPCDLWDPMIADVHSDWWDALAGDPGVVLHEAVGNVNLLLIAVDNGSDRTVYAGHVLSHYEFEEPGTTRLNDAAWKTQILNNQKPPAPGWTTSFLVPGSIPIPAGNQ